MNFVSVEGLIDKEVLGADSQDLLHVDLSHSIDIELTGLILFIISKVVLFAPDLIQIHIGKRYGHS